MNFGTFVQVSIWIVPFNDNVKCGQKRFTRFIESPMFIHCTREFLQNKVVNNVRTRVTEYQLKIATDLEKYLM